MLLAEGCMIAAYDPAAMKRTEQHLAPGPNLSYVEDSYAAAKDADALIVLTDWQEFATLNLLRLHEAMRYPIVIDGRNLFDPQIMAESGFTYLSIGRPAAHPVRASAPAASTHT
jgi:UDPglucose 6-dehydrogenase